MSLLFGREPLRWHRFKFLYKSNNLTICDKRNPKNFTDGPMLEVHRGTLAKRSWLYLSLLQSKWWRCGHQLAQPRGGLCNSHPSSSLCLHNQAKLVSASEPSVCYMNSKSEAKQLSNHVGNTGPTESSGIVSELTWFHQGSRWTE